MQQQIFNSDQNQAKEKEEEVGFVNVMILEQDQLLSTNIQF